MNPHPFRHNTPVPPPSPKRGLRVPRPLVLIGAGALAAFVALWDAKAGVSLFLEARERGAHLAALTMLFTLTGLSLFLFAPLWVLEAAPAVRGDMRPVYLLFVLGLLSHTRMTQVMALTR